jgi:hypothetical protein
MALWDYFGSWTPAQWSASATVAAVVIAAIAAFVGLRQLRVAEQTRREQAQPYVAVYMEPLTAVDPKFHELVIKNFGATAAYDVRVESDPLLAREWHGKAQDVPLPSLPTLVPGQEWRVLWDFFPRRHDAGLPSRHEVKVHFEDSHRESFSLDYTLDWSVNLDRLSVRTLTIHHGVKELQNIAKLLGRR